MAEERGLQDTHPLWRSKSGKEQVSESRIKYMIQSIQKQGCFKQYWGCTKRLLYIRFAEHLDTIKDPETTCAVGRHWRSLGTAAWQC